MNILDIIGVLIVFGIVGYVGYYSSKKVDNSEDFLMAGRNLGKWQAGLSLAATDFGGSGLVGGVGYCYVIGLAGAWWNWTAAPAFILLGLFLAKKLRPLALNTAPEFLEKRYNKNTRTVTAIMHICAMATKVAVQFTVASVTLNVIAGIPKTISLWITVAFVLLYTVGGGLIAVVNTDVVQFVIIVGSLIIAVPLALMNVGGLAGIQEALPASFLDAGSTGFWEPFSWALMCLFAYATQQNYLHRLLAAKDVKTAKFAYVFTGGFYVIIGTVVAIIGLTCKIMMPDIASSGQVYAMFIKTILPVGLSGLALGGIFAASMSTADSILLSVTTLFVNDIYKPLFGGSNKDDKRVLLFSRIVTIIVALIGVAISMASDSIIQLIYIGGVFYSAVIFYPLILGIYWKRANTVGTISGMFVSVIVSAMSEFVWIGNLPGIMGTLPSIFTGSTAGLIVLIVVSLLTKPNGKHMEMLEAQ